MNPSDKPAQTHPAPHARAAQPPPTADRGRARRVAWSFVRFSVICALLFLFKLPAVRGGAVRAWRANRAAALAAHGPVALWNTSGETDLSCLFKDARSFNEDLNRFGASRVFLS